MNAVSRVRVVVAGCVVSASLCGCVAGPAALELSRVRYNQAIQTTRAEQLLLNLVRLQYREDPLFLDVGTVAAQFTFRASGDAGATIREGPSPNPMSFNFGAGLFVEERPTITLTPLQGKEFAQRLLTPLDLDTIALLARSGWSIGRVLRLTVQNMNGLDNAFRASGPTPADPPRYEAFARACELFRALQVQGMLQLGHEAGTSEPFISLPIESVGLADVVAAKSAGYHFEVHTTETASYVDVMRNVSALVWHIPQCARGSDEVAELVQLLGLVPGRSSYEIRLGQTGQRQASDSAGGREAVSMTTRSLMGVLFYLSQAVEVPSAHRTKGYVTTTVDAAGIPFDWSRVTGDLLRIRSRRTAPGDAAVAIRQRGYWFYIDNSDLPSKSTMAFMGQLFALQAGTTAAGPLTLTLPVGG